MSADALRRKLLNDEPKCANCKKWLAAPYSKTHGVCQLMLDGVPGGGLVEAIPVTDLSLCSAWEQKIG